MRPRQELVYALNPLRRGAVAAVQPGREFGATPPPGGWPEATAAFRLRQAARWLRFEQSPLTSATYPYDVILCRLFPLAPVST